MCTWLCVCRRRHFHNWSPRIVAKRGTYSGWRSRTHLHAKHTAGTIFGKLHMRANNLSKSFQHTMNEKSLLNKACVNNPIKTNNNICMCDETSVFDLGRRWMRNSRYECWEAVLTSTRTCARSRCS